MATAKPKLDAAAILADFQEPQKRWRPRVGNPAVRRFLLSDHVWTWHRCAQCRARIKRFVAQIWVLRQQHENKSRPSRMRSYGLS